MKAVFLYSANFFVLHGGQAYRLQGLTEYAVVLSLVAVAAIAGMAFFGGAVRARISSLAAAVAGEKKEVIDAENKRASAAAKKSAEAASQVDGMAIESAGSGGAKGAEVIDDVNIQ